MQHVINGVLVRVKVSDARELTMTTNSDWTDGAAEALILFGPFRLLPKQRLLMQADKPVRLGSRAFDVLIALLERRGELVSKEELMARVWPNTFVESANLAVHISALRRALGDDRAANRYVVNISGRGYRFVAPVTIVEDPPWPAPAVTQANLWPRAVRSIERTVQDRALHLAHGYLLALARLGAGKTGVTLALVPETINLQQDGAWRVNLNSVEDQ
jgi:DNA-binding winged helix-turn-helix (wHTH) protein